MFKFKKGDKVQVKFVEMFSSAFGGSSFYTTEGAGYVITDRRVHPDGKNQYKLKSFTGWWDECTLEPA